MLRECARSCATSTAAHDEDIFPSSPAMTLDAPSQPGEVLKQRDHNGFVADGHQGYASSPATAAASAAAAAATPSFSVEEVELRITEARANSFAELREAHEQDCRETLWRAWRVQQEELERITNEAREREAILEGRLNAALRRAEEAEAQVERFSSGEERRSLEGRIQQLAQSLERTELHAKLSEDSLASCMQDLKSRASAAASRMVIAKQRIVQLKRACSGKERYRRLQKPSRQCSLSLQSEQLRSAPELLPGLEDNTTPPKSIARLLMATLGTVIFQLMALAIWRLLAVRRAFSMSRGPFVQQRQCGPS